MTLPGAIGQIFIAGEDLSSRWCELVEEDHVTAITTLTDGGGELQVKYGVRQQGESARLVEFVEILSETGNSSHRDRVETISLTLTEMQSQSAQGIQCVCDDPFAAQLQLVRTLRPARSKAMSSDADESPKCTPPPYDASSDSFLVGSLRLFGVSSTFHGDGQPRPRAARLPIKRLSKESLFAWDVYHNVSPVDPRGHFLLLPAMDDQKNWRCQSLTHSDCQDVTYLASTIKPARSSVITFNSVGAGATQNHIHLHLWPSPPPPLLEYAVTQARTSSSMELEDGVVSMLDYPCTCIRMRCDASSACATNRAAEVLAKVVDIAQWIELPYNVSWMNDIDDTQRHIVDAYVFFRSAEASSVVGNCEGDFRPGGSELLGLFHATSREQLDAFAQDGAMESILRSVSFEPREQIWTKVCQVVASEQSKIG